MRVKDCATFTQLYHRLRAHAAISPVGFNSNPCVGMMQVCLLYLEIRHANRIRSDSEMVITSVFETGVRGSIPRRSIVLGMTL